MEELQMNKMRKRNKIEKPLMLHGWSLNLKLYHNKSSQHFYLGVFLKSDYVAGHDMTTHPLLNKVDGKPKSRFIPLNNNPNVEDIRISYINKHLRIVKQHYDDTWNKRLVEKKSWKISRIDRMLLKKMDIKKSAQLNLGNRFDISADVIIKPKDY